MLSVVWVHLPTRIPIPGCELTAYVVVRHRDSTLSADDVTLASSVDGCALRCRWFRLQSEQKKQKVLVCSVHPSEPATLQCKQCTKGKLTVSKSYHCTAKCFVESWRHHLVMHREAANNKRSNGAASNGVAEPTKALNQTTTRVVMLSNGSAHSNPVRMATAHAQREVWCEVGQGKTYTPTADDVGHILKFECVAIDGSTGRQVAAPTQIQTSAVIPSPLPAPRRLISANPMDAMAAVDPKDRTAAASAGTFTVLSYNVLSDLFATSELYSYCPPWALAWIYRRNNLLREILGYRADILCLQEVQSDHYEEFFAPELEKHGYTGVYKKKTGEVYTGSVYVNDGCATFFRRNCFSLVKKYEVEFNKAAQSLSKALLPTTKKAALTRLLKGNVALIVVLEARDIGTTVVDSQVSVGKRRQLLCVANTHIHANQELKDVKLWQVHTLLKGLEKIANNADIPMLVAGDFNSVPGRWPALSPPEEGPRHASLFTVYPFGTPTLIGRGSAPHALLATGCVDGEHPDLQVDPLSILRPLSKLRHTLPLRSAYSVFGRITGIGPEIEMQRRRMDLNSNEPLFTNCTRNFLGTLDYIFYTTDSLTVESLLELVDEDSLRKDTGLPSQEWSSDHIALLAEFSCKPRQRH